MATYDDFWSKAGPGLLDFGAGLYTRRQGQSEAADRLRAAQGPVFQQSNAAASGMLSQLGSANPDQFAADRFNAGEALVAPVQEKQLGDLMRTLRAKGQLGLSTYNPGVEGITPDGTPMNPKLAAFFAAQNADRAKRAAASMQQGQDYIGNLVSRAGMLQTTANAAQNTGLTAQRTQPSRAASTAELIKGGLGVLKDAGVVKDIFRDAPGMISGGIDWIKNLFGGGGGDYFGGADFSLGF